MKVILISDVHANWPALKAFEENAGYADYVIHAGDSVGYYPFPNECVNWLKEHSDANVIGNHDYAVANSDYNHFSSDSQAILHWTEQELSASNLKYLSNLPQTWTGEVNGLRIGVVHGGLTDPLNELITVNTNDELLNNYLKKLGVKVLIIGHAHQLFVKQVSEGLIINPGSIGQPRDFNPNPSYIELEVNEGVVKTIKPKRFSYSISEVEKKTISESLPTRFLNILRKGY